MTRKANILYPLLTAFGILVVIAAGTNAGADEASALGFGAFGLSIVGLALVLGAWQNYSKTVGFTSTK